MLKILQVHNRQMMVGGADVVLEREANLLRAHGHEVELFSVESKEIHRIGVLRTAWKAVWNRAAAKALQERIREYQPDIAHFHTVFPLMSPAVFRAAHQAGVPTLETMHNFRLVCPGGLLKRQGTVCHQCVGKKVPWPSIVHGCYRGSRLHSIGMTATLSVHHAAGTFAHHVDRYLALTEFVKQMMIRGGYPAEKIVVKPNFIATKRQPGTGRGGYALFVGRFHPEKGVMTLVNAWKRVPAHCKLILVGDGPQRDQVLEHAQGLNIEVRDWLDSEAIFDLLEEAAFLVFPSNCYETGPLVPIESFSCGTPVLASDIGNFSAWIQPGRNGWLFRTDDSEDLAAKITTAFADPTLGTTMRIAAKQTHQEDFSDVANYELLMRIYQEVIAERTASRC